eukprot:gene16072-18354_t
MTELNTVEHLQALGLQAKQASAQMAKASAAVKNQALRRLADLLRENTEALQLDNAKDLANELAYMKARRNWRNAEYYAYNPAASVVERSDYIAIQHHQEQTANRLEARWNAGANQLVAGWEAATVNFLHTNNSPYGGSSTVAPTGFNPGVFDSPNPLRPNFATDTATSALYIEDAYSLSDNLVGLAGARHDRYEVDRVSLLGAGGFRSTLISNSVRLGLTWKLAPHTSLYGQLSTGSDPLTSLLSLNLASARYKLTRSRQVEGGVKQSLAHGKAEWTAALYRIRKDDIVTRDPSNPALSVQGGSQSSQGAELSASASLAPSWRVDANLAYTDAQFDNLTEGGNLSRAGKRPPDVPEVSANLWLSYKADAWRAGAGARQVTLRFMQDSVQQLLKRRVDAEPAGEFDVVYCAGLFDYLSDKVCARMIAYFTARMRSGGQLLLTNVHASNPERPGMEHLLEWYLIHRDERKMQQLLPFEAQHRHVYLDATGVNVFAEAGIP